MKQLGVLTTMPTDTYRQSVNALAILSGGAFAGGNLFIGLSMGAYWLSLPPDTFYGEFWEQFQRFLFTIMPLFILTLIGLILSARLDWQDRPLRKNWLVAFGLFVAISLITLLFHMPLNLRIAAASISAQAAATSESFGLLNAFGQATLEDASANRASWLLGHIPRVVIAFYIPFFALRAVTQRRSGAE